MKNCFSYQQNISRATGHHSEGKGIETIVRVIYSKQFSILRVFPPSFGCKCSLILHRVACPIKIKKEATWCHACATTILWNIVSQIERQRTILPQIQCFITERWHPLRAGRLYDTTDKKRFSNVSYCYCIVIWNGTCICEDIIWK